MNKNTLKAGLLVAGSLMFTQAFAAEGNDDFATGLYLAPGINYMDVHNIFDRKHTIGLERKVGANLSAGYQFDNPWAVEFMYQYVSTKMDTVRPKADMKINYGHLDALYTFNTFQGSGWAPYAVAGIGRMSYNVRGFDKWDTTLNMGAGVKYAFTPRFQFRMDGRYTLGTAHVDSGASLNMALVLVLGNHYTHGATEKAVTEPVQEQPAAIEEQPKVIETVVVDSDGDGIPDHLDQCPDTTPGAKVDENGCYILLTENHEFTLNVVFGLGSAVISADSKDDVRDLAKFMKEYPNTEVTIEGHSDSTGSATLNKRLSQQRADAVKQSLVDEFGIKQERLTSVGYGSEQPIADNATVDGRAKNRRVVAKVQAQVTKIQED